jgi:hypothetical protein
MYNVVYSTLYYVCKVLLCVIYQLNSTVFLYVESESHITTDDQSVSPSWCRGPSGSHDRILISV